MKRQCKAVTDQFGKVHSIQMTMYQSSARDQMIHDTHNISNLFSRFSPALVCIYNQTDPNNLVIYPAILRGQFSGTKALTQFKSLDVIGNRMSFKPADDRVIVQSKFPTIASNQPVIEDGLS